MFSVLTSKIFGGMSLALAAALAFVSISKNAEISALQKSIDKPVTGWAARLNACTIDLATVRGNAALLSGALSDQNRAVSDLEARAAAAHAKGAFDRSEAAKKVSAAQAQVAALRNARAGADQCASADQLILENVR